MLPPILERLISNATLRMDVEDGFAQRLRTRGPHPRPLGNLRFWLIGPFPVGNPPASAMPWELVMQVNNGGYHLFFDRVMRLGGVTAQRVDVPDPQTGVLQPKYVITLPPPLPRSALLKGSTQIQRIQLPAGRYAVVITSDFYQQTTRADIALPMRDPVTGAPTEPYLFTLEPGYAYPFPAISPAVPNNLGGGTVELVTGPGGPTLLRGSVHAPGGQGIAGATVSAAGANSYFTDDAGQWALVFAEDQASGQVTVNIRQPDNNTVNVPNVSIEKGCESSLAETALRGWVQKKGIGVPGATVTVSGQPVPVQTGLDGGWFYYLSPIQPAGNVDVKATLPDGSSLTVPNVQIQPRGTVLVPTFRFQ